MPFATSILVATDLSPASHAALEEAARLAREASCAVTMLYVFDVPARELLSGVANPASTIRRITEEANGAAQSVLLGLRERFFPDLHGVAIRTKEHPSPAQAICAAAHEQAIDLIVVASHGRSGAEAGDSRTSVAEQIVRAAPCRVLVVPSRLASEFAH